MKKLWAAKIFTLILCSVALIVLAQDAVKAASKDFDIKDGVLLSYRGKESDVKIPDTVTSIGDNAFKGYTGLKSVKIPKSLKKIGNSAFFGCSGLKSITIPDSVKEIGDRAFVNCTSLKNVTIPNSVKKIGNYALLGVLFPAF